MSGTPRIAFIGAGSTVFMKNIVSDILLRPATSGATIALMDINTERLAESEIVAGKIISTLGVKAKVETHTNQRKALEKADFVVVAFVRDSESCFNPGDCRVGRSFLRLGYYQFGTVPRMRHAGFSQFRREFGLLIERPTTEVVHHVACIGVVRIPVVGHYADASGT